MRPCVPVDFGASERSIANENHRAHNGANRLGVFGGVSVGGGKGVPVDR